MPINHTDSFDDSLPGDGSPDIYDAIFLPEPKPLQPVRGTRVTSGHSENIPILSDPEVATMSAQDLEAVNSPPQAQANSYREKLHSRVTASDAIPVIIFASVAAVALMPMLLTHLKHLSHLTHRAHFGLILFSFLFLVLQRWLPTSRKPNLEITVSDVGLLVAAGLIFAIASSGGSPWLATLSCILLAGFFLRRLPATENVGYLGPWGMLLLLLPLPLGFDQKLIKSLQEFATQCSSRMLDLIGVNHLISGNVIELPGSQLFIDEACSGVQSLFAMLTCVAFFAAWTRRPTVLALSLVVSSIVMCTITNIMRIIIVVVAQSRGVDLLEGWPHECLGVGLFVVALMLVYCSEGLFLYILAPVINPATGSPDNASARFWNNLTRSIHAAVYGVTEAELPPVPIKPSVLQFRIPGAFTRIAMIGATTCFAIFAIGQHVGKAESPSLRTVSKQEAAMLERCTRLSEDSLPETVGSWKRLRFERIDRDESSITDTAGWIFQSPFYDVTISLDYPFYGAHNVTECYHLRGWDVQDETTTKAGYSKAKLFRPFGEIAFLYYDVFDANGTIRLESAGGRLVERMREFEESGDRPTWQIQLIVRSDFGLSANDLREAEANFIQIRDYMTGLIRGTINEPLMQTDSEGVAQ